MNLPPERFDDQLAWLSAEVRVLDLGEAVAELGEGQRVEPGVVLTFDDGTADWVDHVLPALERHGVPATFYVATSFVEHQRPLPDGATPVSWAGLRDAVSTGLVTVGSHTHRHRLLDREPPAVVRHELDRSVGLIHDRVGQPVDHFCYPKALPPTAAADREVRSRFRSAALAGTRANGPGADLHRLARSPIVASDSPTTFRAKAVGGMWLEDAARRWAGARRNRAAEN